MTFRIHALPAGPFEADFQLDDATLRERGIRRVIADGKPHYPCRVSLQDAVEGERLLLLPFLHHDVDTPYRASGPIYVREDAVQAQPAVERAVSNYGEPGNLPVRAGAWARGQ